MEIASAQKVGLLTLEPFFGGHRPTLGAMTVTARVVARALKAAMITPLQMTAKR